MIIDHSVTHAEGSCQSNDGRVCLSCAGIRASRAVGWLAAKKDPAAIENLEGAIEQARKNLDGASERDNPYYSPDLEYQARGYWKGLVMAHQIMAGVRK